MRRPAASVRMWPGITERLDFWWQRASGCVDCSDDAEAFLAGRGPLTLQQTRQAHYACFVEGVAAAEWAAARTSCAVVVPYSMGLFAGYYFTSALGFEEALWLMDQLCLLLQAQAQPRPYSTGAIAGVPKLLIDKLLARAIEPVGLADWYDDDVFFVSGPEHAVEDVLAKARGQGATYTKSTPATAPYHTQALPFFEDAARQCLSNTSVSPPRIPVISSIDGKIVRSSEDVCREIVGNVCHTMNWRATIKAVASGPFQVTTVVECGSSVSLTEMVRHHLTVDPVDSTLTALARSNATP